MNKILKVFYEDRGKPSLKRILGSFMIVSGVLFKYALCAYAIRKQIELSISVDNSIDSIITGGAVLLFGTIVDKFIKKDE